MYIRIYLQHRLANPYTHGLVTPQFCYNPDLQHNEELKINNEDQKYFWICLSAKLQKLCQTWGLSFWYRNCLFLTKKGMTSFWLFEQLSSVICMCIALWGFSDGKPISSQAGVNARFLDIMDRNCVSSHVVCMLIENLYIKITVPFTSSGIFLVSYKLCAVSTLSINGQPRCLIKYSGSVSFNNFMMVGNMFLCAIE